MGSWNTSVINGSTFEGAYVGTAQSLPWLFPLVLFFEFMVILLSGVGIQNRRVGFSNIPMWGSISGLVTSTTAIMWSGVWSVINGGVVPLVNLVTLGVCVAVTIGFAFWFLFTDLD